MADVPGTAYDALPEDVQKAIKNLGDTAFSIQQLLFDPTVSLLSRLLLVLTAILY
jgi:hypothetical protein